MRGKLTDGQKLHRRIGITPADAGKTHQLGRMVFPYVGSPPRMRGKQRISECERIIDGITPADAGKTYLL